MDHYWEELSTGGAPQAQQYGWLADRFGLSRQVLPAMLTDADPAKSLRAFQAMLQMKKLDIAALQRAFEG